MHDWDDDDEWEEVVVAGPRPTAPPPPPAAGGGASPYDAVVITCVVEYTIDAAKIDAFERFAERWMTLVEEHGGTHHGYFLPAEGASDKARARVTFASLAADERYREGFGPHALFGGADRLPGDSGWRRR
ncbi:NIPSNAP family protein, partial [Streptomyces tricolor]